MPSNWGKQYSGLIWPLPSPECPPKGRNVHILSLHCPYYTVPMSFAHTRARAHTKARAHRARAKARAEFQCSLSCRPISVGVVISIAISDIIKVHFIKLCEIYELRQSHWFPSRCQHIGTISGAHSKQKWENPRSSLFPHKQLPSSHLCNVV